MTTQPTTQIELSANDLRLIIAALLAVSPSGGNSGPYALSMRLRENDPFHHGDADYELVRTFANTAIKEAHEAGVLDDIVSKF